MKERNKNKPGYKKTKIGWLPEDWEYKKAKHYFDNRKEKGYKSLPVLSVTINSGLIRRNTIDRKIAPGIPPEKSLLVKKNDIAYNMMRMWQGAIGVATEDGILSPAYIVLRTKNNYNSIFAYYLFKSNHFMYLLKSYSYGLTADRLRLYYKDFTLIPCPCPPLPEQKKIAQILSAWDSAIEKTQKLIEEKQKLKKGLIQKLLTGKVRFPDFKNPPNPPLIKGGSDSKVQSQEAPFNKGGGAERGGLKSEVNDMPIYWKRVRLGEVFKERNETGFNNLQLLSITGSHGVVPFDDLERKDSSNTDKSKYKRIVPGDIGYNTMRMWQGRSALSSQEGIVSPAYTICIPSNEISGLFASYLFKTDFMVHQFYKNSQGLTSDTWNLKYHNFSRIKVNIPGIDEQTRIASTLSTMDREIELLKKKLNALKEQKKGLMQKLLTGEVRLKT